MADRERGASLTAAGTRRFSGQERSPSVRSEGDPAKTGNEDRTKDWSKRKGPQPARISQETTDGSSSTDSNSKPVISGAKAPDPNLTIGSSSSASNNEQKSQTVVSGFAGRVEAGDERPEHRRGPSETSKSLLLFSESLLSRPAELVEGEPGSDTSAGSSNSTGTPVFCLPLPPPLPPVPAEMAEAIKRQQKGAGSVRYWKAKHLQSGGGQPLSLKGGSGVVQNAMLPVLKPPMINHSHGAGGGGGVAVNGSGSSRADSSKCTRARERLIRQRGKENLLVDGRRSSSSHGHHCPHTQYMFGHSLGFPQPPAAYRRSVTTLENLLSLPFPTPSYLNANPTHRLTQVSVPNPPHKLTQTSTPKAPPLRLGELPQGGSDSQGKTQEEGRELQQHDQVDIASKDQENGENTTTVSELTCLQLADTILSTKTADLSRFYQICQTKIRYLFDLLLDSLTVL